MYVHNPLLAVRNVFLDVIDTLCIRKLNYKRRETSGCGRSGGGQERINLQFRLPLGCPPATHISLSGYNYATLPPRVFFPDRPTSPHTRSFLCSPYTPSSAPLERKSPVHSFALVRWSAPPVGKSIRVLFCFIFIFRILKPVSSTLCLRSTNSIITIHNLWSDSKTK